MLPRVDASAAIRTVAGPTRRTDPACGDDPVPGIDPAR